MGNMVQGLLATVIGISIVMLVLLLLSFVLDFLKLLSVKPSAENAARTTPEAEEPKKKIDDDFETAAVIAAALAAYLHVSPDGLVVRSVRKVVSWKDATRREQQRRFY